MRIVIDCFKLVKGAGKSIGIYNVAVDLVRILSAERGESDEIIVIANEYNKKEFEAAGVQIHVVKGLNPLNKIHCIWWELFGVTFCRARLAADRVVFPRGYSSFGLTSKDVVIIHDLIPFYYAENFPDVFNKIENAYIMSRLKYSAKHARSVITISETSKADILRRFKVSESKVKVIYNGYDAIDLKKKKTDMNMDMNMVMKPYIYANTSALPHKNAVGIVKAYVKYCEIAKNPIDLVIVGIEDAGAYGLPNELASRVQCYKYIEDNNDMYSLIANSKAFLFLSLMEGFGLPPIEAMQLKVPVVCSDRASLPEVVGDAGILVNPDDSLAVAEALDNVISDEKLREDLIKKGIKNLDRFSREERGRLYWEAILG